MEQFQTKTNMHFQQQLERAGAVDVHREKLMVCVYIQGLETTVVEYGTYTCDLEKVRDDFLKQGIREVIMESTGIYWIALCTLLTNAGIHVTVVNPRFVKNMPKEKTDKKDARWLCKLLVNGLVRNSFITSEEQRAFRDLCRMRTRYSNHISQARNRILKNLERRNIKLRSVVSNMHTVTAMSIVKALAEGETDIEKMIALSKGRIKEKAELMRKALVGVITDHDRMMLRGQLSDIDHYQKQIDIIEDQIHKHTDKINQQLIENLRQIKGVGERSAQIILAEIGDNVKPFATADKLAAWTGVAPGNKESAGKNYYVGRRDGNKHLRTALVQVAWAAVRTKDTYWRGLYYHLKKRMSKNKAVVVVARKLLKIIYKVIKGTKSYVEYGIDYFMQRLQQRYAERNPLVVA